MNRVYVYTIIVLSIGSIERGYHQYIVQELSTSKQIRYESKDEIQLNDTVMVRTKQPLI